MPPILKALLPILAVIVVIYIGFQVHWLLGVGLILALLGYGIYANRSAKDIMKANAAYTQGDTAKALALLEKVYHSNAAKPQHSISYAFLLMKEGQLEKAEQVLHKLLTGAKATDFRMQVKTQLATAYWLLGRREESIALLEEVYTNYKTVTIVGNLGYFKVLYGDLDAALAFNLDAYAYDDNDLTILDNLAQTYYLLGRMDEAEELYRKVIAKSPKHAESYYYYALTLQAQGQQEEAVEFARQALDKPLALVTNISKEDIERLANAEPVND